MYMFTLDFRSLILCEPWISCTKHLMTKKNNYCHHEGSNVSNLNLYISLVLFILYLDFVYFESYKYAFCNFILDRGPQVY